MFAYLEGKVDRKILIKNGDIVGSVMCSTNEMDSYIISECTFDRFPFIIWFAIHGLYP